MTDILDVITPTEAQASVSALGTGNDTMISLYITAVSQALDGLYGPIVARSVTDTHHIPAGWYDVTVGLIPYERPVLSITSVTEYDTANAAQVLTAESTSSLPAYGYYYDPASNEIQRRGGGFSRNFPPGGKVVVVYQAGRYADTASVDAKFKTAAIITFQNLWRFGFGTGNQSFGATTDGSVPGFLIPYAAQSLLADELLMPGIC